MAKDEFLRAFLKFYVEHDHDIDDIEIDKLLCKYGFMTEEYVDDGDMGEHFFWKYSDEMKSLMKA